MSLPPHVDPNRRLQFGQHHVFNEQTHHLFALGVGRGLGLPYRRQIVDQVEDGLPLRLTDMACRRWRRAA